jgi:hypothetical protein
VVAKHPDFPRDISAGEKVEILKEIVAEMLKFFSMSGLQCHLEGNRCLVTRFGKGLWGRRPRTWQLTVLYDEANDGTGDPAESAPDALLSLRSLPSKWRRALGRRGVMWMDIENKERSLGSNDLGEEVALFLRRYGVRFFRVED